MRRYRWPLCQSVSSWSVDCVDRAAVVDHTIRSSHHGRPNANTNSNNRAEDIKLKSIGLDKWKKNQKRRKKKANIFL